MNGGKATYPFFVVVAALILPLFAASCKNDLKSIQAVSDMFNKTEMDSTKGINMLYSDSGRVKARIVTPLMLEFVLSEKVKDPYMLMSKGIKVILYDKTLQEQGNIVADTAYYYNVKQRIEFKKNVVITSAKGDTYRSDELIWDKTLNKIYSDKPVDFAKADGSKAHGTGMDTNESLYPFHLHNSTGLFFFDKDFSQ